MDKKWTGFGQRRGGVLVKEGANQIGSHLPMTLMGPQRKQADTLIPEG